MPPPIRWEEHRAQRQPSAADHAEQLVQLCILLALALCVTLFVTVVLPAFGAASC